MAQAATILGRAYATVDERVTPGNCLADYVFIEALGRGSFGQVQKAESRINGRTYVLKQVSCKSLDARGQELAAEEALLLRRVRHPNIIRYYTAFVDGDNLFIVMEYAERGDLQHYINKYRKRRKLIEEAYVWQYVVELSSALKELHRLRIIHRDVKCVNIFLGRNFESKLGDLGASRLMSSSDKLSNCEVGTPLFTPPEMVRKQPYDFKADVWALGCVFYYLASSHAPFQKSTMHTLNDAIVSDEPAPLPPERSERLQSLISSMLTKDPARRPDMETVLVQAAGRAQELVMSPLSGPGDHYLGGTRPGSSGWAASLNLPTRPSTSTASGWPVGLLGLRAMSSKLPPTTTVEVRQNFSSKLSVRARESNGSSSIRVPVVSSTDTKLRGPVYRGSTARPVTSAGEPSNCKTQSGNGLLHGLLAGNRGGDVHVTCPSSTSLEGRESSSEDDSAAHVRPARPATSASASGSIILSPFAKPAGYDHPVDLLVVGDDDLKIPGRPGSSSGWSTTEGSISGSESDHTNRRPIYPRLRLGTRRGSGSNSTDLGRFLAGLGKRPRTGVRVGVDSLRAASQAAPNGPNRPATVSGGAGVCGGHFGSLKARRMMSLSPVQASPNTPSPSPTRQPIASPAAPTDSRQLTNNWSPGAARLDVGTSASSLSPLPASPLRKSPRKRGSPGKEVKVTALPGGKQWSPSMRPSLPDVSPKAAFSGQSPSSITEWPKVETCASCTSASPDDVATTGQHIPRMLGSVSSDDVLGPARRPVNVDASSPAIEVRGRSKSVDMNEFAQGEDLVEHAAGRALGVGGYRGSAGAHHAVGNPLTANPLHGAGGHLASVGPGQLGPVAVKLGSLDRCGGTPMGARPRPTVDQLRSLGSRP
mmetsp:Transcript_21663/g.50984  ORF Transcript_21663/g.50984 Transcript_21663/m.50984 type:complete len:875 (-) Transcript_21663:117-2741(-)